jgi:hypothetical protein
MLREFLIPHAFVGADSQGDGHSFDATFEHSDVVMILTVRHPGMGTGISEASKRVPIISFATQGCKQVSSYFRQRNWVQA